jgi:hypothetical protein
MKPPADLHQELRQRILALPDVTERPNTGIHEDAFSDQLCRSGILRQGTWSFTNATGEADRVSMKSLTNGGQSYGQNN